ncbi:MAG TPA: YetF domain-containing protein [Luteibacter sp.]|jgi:uncharacterized membrane protein YcaP (DUF421 family)|nr:YetF domain-containing protein [Luteibacter sp.]
MNHAFDLSMPWWHFALRGALVYLGLLVMLRLTGKRTFGEMSAFDVIVLTLVGGTLRTSIIGDDTSFAGAFIGVAAILATDKALGWASARLPRFNRLVEGIPAILARHGQRDRKALTAHDVPEAAFDRALHAAGLETETDVELARLEPNGKITLVRRGGS